MFLAGMLSVAQRRKELRKQSRHRQWLKVKGDPVRYAQWKAVTRESMRKLRMKKKSQAFYEDFGHSSYDNFGVPPESF